MQAREGCVQDNIVRPAFKTVDGGNAEASIITEDVQAKFDALTLADFDALKLSDPKYGDLEIGKLTDDECLQFVRFHTAINLHKLAEREVGGAQLEALGAGIRSGKISMDTGPVDADDITDHESITDYFRLSSYCSYYRAVFYHNLSMRLGHWEYTLGIRTHRRIVRAKRRYGAQ